MCLEEPDERAHSSAQGEGGAIQRRVCRRCGSRCRASLLQPRRRLSTDSGICEDAGWVHRCCFGDLEHGSKGRQVEAEQMELVIALGIAEDAPHAEEGCLVELSENIRLGRTWVLNLLPAVLCKGFEDDGSVLQQLVFSMLILDDADYATGIRTCRGSSVSAAVPDGRVIDG